MLKKFLFALSITTVFSDAYSVYASTRQEREENRYVRIQRKRPIFSEKRARVTNPVRSRGQVILRQRRPIASQGVPSRSRTVQTIVRQRQPIVSQGVAPRSRAVQVNVRQRQPIASQGVPSRSRTVQTIVRQRQPIVSQGVAPRSRAVQVNVRQRQPIASQITTRKRVLVARTSKILAPQATLTNRKRASLVASPPIKEVLTSQLQGKALLKERNIPKEIEVSSKLPLIQQEKNEKKMGIPEVLVVQIQPSLSLREVPQKAIRIIGGQKN